MRPLLFIWTEIARPLAEAVGGAVQSYPWLLAIPAAMTVCAAFAVRQELDQ